MSRHATVSRCRRRGWWLVACATSVATLTASGCAAPLTPDQRPTEARPWTQPAVAASSASSATSGSTTDGVPGAPSAAPTVGLVVSRVPTVAPTRVLTRILASTATAGWVYTAADPTGAPSPGPMDISVSVRSGSAAPAVQALKGATATGAIVCGQQGSRTVCLGGTPSGYVEASGALDASSVRAFLQAWARAV